MPPHVMLSYQWDDQALVRRVYGRLKDAGLPVWMDVEGGVTGNVIDAMAAGVEEAAVICPFMTPAYQASRSCKKELSYADSRQVAVVPVMLAREWEASEWLGLLTAGLLWLDFRDAEEDEERFQMCVRSLEEEIVFNAGHLLAAAGAERDRGEEEAEQTDAAERRNVPKRVNKKPGRGFRHALSNLYIHDAGEQLIRPDGDGREAVQLRATPADACYWEEIKGGGCKYYRNVVTGRYLGFDPSEEGVRSVVSPSGSEEWLLLVDQTDQSRQRAVVIKNKQSGRFLAAQNGGLVALASYEEDCRWFLEGRAAERARSGP